MTRRIPLLTAALAFALGSAASTVNAQAPQTAMAIAPAATAAGAVPVAPDYVIGPDDVLSILFWRDKDLSATDVTVRPDGKVTLPLLNDVQASGRTPEQLGDAIREAARKYVEDPNPTVIVKEIKSRRVFITGRIEKPGPYPLNGRTTILQLIAMAGGLREFVDGKNISLMRSEKDKQTVFDFNYQDVVKKRYLHQNIELKPGDVVVVP
jgi:polysaccharide export outer membrane protein